MTVRKIKSIGDIPYPIDVGADALSPLLTAGAALGITGNDAEESAWLARTSEADGVASVRSIHGRTLRWNQLIDLEARTITSQGVSMVAADGKVTLTGTATATVNFRLNKTSHPISVIAGHKFLALGAPRSTGIYINIDGIGAMYSDTIYTAAIAGATRLAYAMVPNGATVDVSFYPQLFDLTAMFGAGNEPSTVAEFEALFLLPYYEYDAGSLMSVNMTGIETVGFNQLDPANVRTNIFINGATGKVSAAPWAQTAIVEVFPNTDYCLTYTGGNRCIIAGIDSMTPAVDDDARVIFADGDTRVSPKVFNTGDNRYIAAYIATSAAPASDICINLSDSTRDGEYEPYWQQTRTIPAGILRSAGSVYDELTATERIVRVGEVDLGNQNWSKSGDYFYTIVADKAVGAYNVTCSKYPTSTDGSLDNGECIGNSNNNRVSIMDTAYTDAATFKAAMSGVMLHYALATPTTQPIDPPLNLTYRTEQGGTERVMVPTGEQSAPPTLVTVQGYTAESLRDAALSAIAPVENGKASTNYGVGSYLIHSGQLCKVTVAIASGEAINIGTNVTATTVMAEVIALIAQ